MVSESRWGESAVSLKRYMCIGGSLNNKWLTLFNDRGAFRHMVKRRPNSAPELEEYRVLRIVDETSNAHEIMTLSTMSEEQALRRWRPRA